MFSRVIHAEYAPRWKYDMLLMPVVYMETEHSTLKLRCEADGRPAPTVTWYKDGKIFNGRQFGSVSIASYNALFIVISKVLGEKFIGWLVHPVCFCD